MPTATAIYKYMAVAEVGLEQQESEILAGRAAFRKIN
jgi:hypothetical protein